MNLTKDWAATLDDYVIDLAWSPSDSSLAAASAAGPIVILGRDGARRHELPGHEGGTNAIAHSGRILASGGQDGMAILWDGQSGARIGAVKCGTGWVEHVCWASDSTLAVSVGRELLFLGTDAAIRHRAKPVAKTITALCRRPGAAQVASAFFGGVQIHNPDDATLRQEFAYANGIHALAWSPDGRWLVSGNQDPSVHLWIPDDSSELHMSGYETKVKHLSFDHTSRWLATSGGRDGCVWDCSGAGPEGREPAMLPHDAPICALAFQNSHGLLATASQDGVVMLWSPERKQPLRATVKMPVPAATLAWSADDLQLAIGTEKGTVYVLKSEQ